MKSCDTRHAKERGDVHSAETLSKTAKNILITTIVCGILTGSVIAIINVALLSFSGS